MKNTSHKYQEKMVDSLQGIINDDEQKELDLWLDQSEKNKSEFDSLKRIWDYTSHSDKEFDVESALDNVNERISSIEKRNIFVRKQNWFVRNKEKAMSAAAVFVMGLMLSFVYFSKRDNTIIYVAENSNEKIELPDGSTVILDQGASVAYNKKFNAKERKVDFSGYARFDIASNPEKPFIVKTDNMLVEVLGTEFDIEAEKNSDNYVVNLFSGKVKMYSIDDNGKQQEQIILLPGERGVYNYETHRIERKYQASSNDCVSSENEILDFNNVSLTAVIDALSKAYDIEIFLDEKYHDLRFTARFENETLESIFNTMSAVFDMQIVRIGNTVTIR